MVESIGVQTAEHRLDGGLRDVPHLRQQVLEEVLARVVRVEVLIELFEAHLKLGVK